MNFYWDLDPILKEGKVRIKIKSLWEASSFWNNHFCQGKMSLLPSALYAISSFFDIYYNTTTIYILLLYSTFLLRQSSHFDNDIVMAAGSHRVRFLSLKFSKIRVCPLHEDEKLNDTAILSFGFFNNFYVFSIFIITWMILTYYYTTTHTHCTYHIMKIYNNLVE